MKEVTINGKLFWDHEHDSWNVETINSGAPLLVDIDSKLLDFAEQVVEIRVRVSNEKGNKS